MAQKEAVHLTAVEGGTNDEMEERLILLVKQWYRETVNERSGYGALYVEVIDSGAAINVDERFKTRLSRKNLKTALA